MHADVLSSIKGKLLSVLATILFIFLAVLLGLSEGGFLTGGLGTQVASNPIASSPGYQTGYVYKDFADCKLKLPLPQGSYHDVPLMYVKASDKREWVFSESKSGNISSAYVIYPQKFEGETYPATGMPLESYFWATCFPNTNSLTTESYFQQEMAEHVKNNSELTPWTYELIGKKQMWGKEVYEVSAVSPTSQSIRYLYVNNNLVYTFAKYHDAINPESLLKAINEAFSAIVFTD